MAIPGPFSWKNSIELNPQPFPADTATRLRSNVTGFDKMGIAIFDVSKGNPAGYAHNFTKTGYAASLPKIVAMYAAFYLQSRLKAISGALGVTTSLATIESDLKKEWSPVLKTTIPYAVGDFPDISSIFSSRSFEFSNSFQKDMDAMMKKSDNWAAGRCIHRIGYDYLNGALTYGGFYSVSEKSGFWLAGDYIPAKHASNRDGRQVPGMGTSQAASAKAASLLLANLARDELISPESSQGMKKVMSNAYSWVRYNAEAHHPGAEVFGKLGLGANKPQQATHDCAIVKYSDAHYVIVTLFGSEALESLFDELDQTAQALFMFRKVVETARSIVGL